MHKRSKYKKNGNNMQIIVEQLLRKRNITQRQSNNYHAEIAN